MIRFYNGKILSFAGGVHVDDNCELWVKDDEISYVGPAAEEKPEFEREIDLNGDVIMPSFKNAHTHTAMTFLRSYADDMPLQDWLEKQVFPMEAKLNGDLLYEMTRIGIMEYLSSGITASFDMYFHNDDYVRANIDCGFRTVICSALNDFDKDPDNVEREYLKFNNYHDLISFCLGVHAEYTTGRDRLQFMSDLVHKYKTPFFAHNSETQNEVDSCLSRNHGKTPTEVFEEMGLFDYGGGGYHCVYLSEHDIEIFRERKLWVVTNPSSNLKLASGIAPLCRYMEEGIPLAIGTDGAASNNALDMFREMYLAAVLQKYLLKDAAACDPYKVLEMACVGGARAMGREDCDDIAVGKKADLIVINMARPNMQPVHNIPKNLVYAGSKENIRMTMVNGKILYEDGKFYIGEEPESIYEKATKELEKIMK